VSDKKVIEHLNVILKNELTAINQYFLHSKILKNAGFTKLANHEYEESIDEMKHADKLAERILFLGGLPNFQDLGKINIGETPKEIINCDLKMEEESFEDLRKATLAADEANDYGTVDLLEEIIRSEEEHILWLRQQVGLIESLGEQNYNQSQV
jgi:bacterioferritin